MHCKIFQQGGDCPKRYFSDGLGAMIPVLMFAGGEVIGIEPQSFVMAGSDVSTGRLTNEDFEW